MIEIRFSHLIQNSSVNKKNSLSHYFIDIDQDLNLDNFNSSDLKLSIKKVSNDTYLKIFDQHITKSTLRPDNFDNLNSSLKIFLNHEDFNFESGIQSFEDLQIENKSDRYQYNLPYYIYEKQISHVLFLFSTDFLALRLLQTI